MMRGGHPLVLGALGALVLTLSACGGGGDSGDEDAFCNALDELSDQIASGGAVEDVDAVVDTANDLIDDAPSGAPLDAANAFGEVVGDAGSDADDIAGAAQEDLGPQAEEVCGIDGAEFAVAPETTTTTEPEETTTTTEPEETTTTVPDTSGGGGGETGVTTVSGVPVPLVGPRAPVPDGIAPAFANLAQGCFVGDMAACDELFITTPVDSVDEAYGDSCGGRLVDGLRVELSCAEVIFGPEDPAAAAQRLGQALDPAFSGATQSCFAGAMQACDDLFLGASDGSFERLYGAVCGGRVPTANELCVPVIGDQAFA